MRNALSLVLVAAVAFLVACESTPDTEAAESQPTTQVSMGAINDTCPIMGETFDQADPPASVTYEGQTVGFCCPGCVKAWNNWDEAKKTDYLVSATK